MRRLALRERSESRDEPANTWLDLGGGFGRWGALLLVFQHLLLLLAPLFYLANLRASLPPGRSTMEDLLLLLAAPEQLVGIADLIALPGVIFLVVGLFLTLFGLRQEKLPLKPLSALFGFGAIAALIAWIPLTVYSAGRATGAVLTLNQVAATGGFTVASALLLGAALLWMLFTLDVQKRFEPSNLTSYHWPVYAGINLLGSAAIAAFFQSLAAGAPSQDALLIGMILKATLIPVLGVMAYSNLRDKFHYFRGLRFASAAAREGRSRRAPLPPPPPPPPPPAKAASGNPKPRPPPPRRRPTAPATRR